MVSTYKGLPPEVIEQRKEELFANLPQSEQVAEFMDEKVAYYSVRIICISSSFFVPFFSSFLFFPFNPNSKPKKLETR